MKFHQVIGKVLVGPTDLNILGISVPGISFFATSKYKIYIFDK